MRLRLRATTITHVGLVRSNNEDSAHAGTRLVALADGIGGMPAGELASDVVVRALAALDHSLGDLTPPGGLGTALAALGDLRDLPPGSGRLMSSPSVAPPTDGADPAAAPGTDPAAGPAAMPAAGMVSVPAGVPGLSGSVEPAPATGAAATGVEGQAAAVPAEAEQAVAALRATVEAANRTIHELSEADQAKDGMGTTVTALMLTGEEVALINVGDSRCYLERDGELYQLTRDDTFVQALVDQGLLTAAEARYHPRRSIVTQALQGLEYQASYAVRSTKVGDRFLLCSDGLSDMVTDDAIGLALRTVPDLDECAQSLIRLALDAGASDNVTVVIADIVAPES